MNFSRNRVASEVSRTIGHDIHLWQLVMDSDQFSSRRTLVPGRCNDLVRRIYIHNIKFSEQKMSCHDNSLLMSVFFCSAKLHLFIFNYIWLTLGNQLFIGTIKSVFYSHFDWALTTWDLLGMRLCHSFWCSKWWQLHNNSNCPAIQVS